MSKISIVTAADINFKQMSDACVSSVRSFGYDVLLYDLGGLGKGKPFDARISELEGAKIPSKPFIILDAINDIFDNDILVWLDADTIMWDRIDDIDIPYDIGVTMRSKSAGAQFPINAGVLFFRKTSATLNFLKFWSKKCSEGYSDQKELNLICNANSSQPGSTLVVKNTQIKLFDCGTYNNFYFKKSQLHAKIIHYKSKHRDQWPHRNEQHSKISK